MKQKLLFYLMLLLGLNSFAQIVNISTGVDNSGNALAVGVNDPNWQIVSNPTPKVCGYHGAWQPTPISGSNAGWINDTGLFYASNPAIYAFERPFSIAAGTTSFTCNFGITTDDFIVSLVLVRPDSSTIPLTIPAGPGYTVSPAITNVISSPMVGTWKIRVVTNFFDTTAGLLVSGTITKSDQTVVCLPATKDAMLHQFTPVTNYGSNTLLRASRHTYTSGGGSGFYTTKVLHQFDLSSIPAGAVITSAIMKLHVNTNPSAVPYNSHYDLGGGTGNGASVRQVAGPWTENTVTWNTAPLLFPTPVTVPSLGNGSTADVVSNVTAMVQNMILTGINNGFEISLTDNSNYYHGLNFASRENTDNNGAFQPELCVTYTVPQTTVCVPALKDAMLHEFTPTTNYGTDPLLRASRHTYTSGGGNGFYTTKVLHQFDLSSIPAGAIITSATMILHVDTISAPPYNTHYDLGGGTGNGATVRQVAVPWAENVVTWNTAPALLAGSVTVPSLGNGSTADVVSNVTAMVQNMVSSGINNGFEISLADNSDYYHGLNFASR